MKNADLLQNINATYSILGANVQIVREFHKLNAS